MATKVAWDLLDEAAKRSELAPEGQHVFSVDRLEMAETKNGIKSVKATFKITTKPHEGRLVFIDYVLGTSVDPQAEDPEVQAKSFGFQDIARIVKAVGVERKPDLERTLPLLKNKRFVGTVVHRTEPETRRDGTPNPYAGYVRVTINKIGPVQDGPKADTNGAGKVSGKAMAAKLAAEESTDDGDEE